MATQRTVSFHTLGCKLNFSETSSISKQFQNHGFLVNGWKDYADIYVLNTCSVTDFADRKCRKAVRDVKKINPDSKVVVIGCYAQLKPKEISEIDGVDLVLGAKEKFNLVHHVDQLTHTLSEAKVIAGEISEANTFVQAYSHDDRTRTFLKIQDGCNYKCSFCTIPLARGNSRSDTVENVISNVHEIAAFGKKEIVLTGVNIGDFGNGTEVIEGTKPKKEALFVDLIQELDVQDGIERFRISSIEPNLCTHEIIEFVAGSKHFVPHFHMPLQSGSNNILRMMRRRYKRELYEDRVQRIKELMPHACIGVDVIVGFPGETEEEFMATYDFLHKLDISYLHVFTYSERPNTKALDIEGVVDMGERRRRNQMLRNLSEKKKRNFYKQHIGSVRNVLVEESKKEGFLSGYTDNYVRVEMPFQEGVLNSIQKVKLVDFTTDGLVSAEIIH